MHDGELRLVWHADDPSAQALDAARFGLKAAWLDRAARAGENVPPALAISARLALLASLGDEPARLALAQALQPLLARTPEGATFAVRSSPSRSLPGALATRLGVLPAVGQIVAALCEVVASAERPHVAAQLSAQTAGTRADALLTASPEPWVAVLVQQEVSFPQHDDLGAVLLTHDPRSGEQGARGEYARGGPSAVVSGRARPLPLRGADAALANVQPAALATMEALAERLLALFDQPLELELGFAAGSLVLLQVRALTLAPRALVRVALAAIESDSPRYAQLLIELAERGLVAFAETHFVEAALRESPALMRGLPASPGAAEGVVVTDVARAIERATREPVILLRPDAVPEDVAAFRVAAAVVTSSGGLTCHAAVIARGLSVPALVGVQGVRIDASRGVVYGGRDTREAILKEGDWVSVDARRGTLHRGRLPLRTELRDGELRRLFAEARKLRPTPLWVMGEALAALRLKDDASLDGALCAWPASGELPEAVGRECWVEIDAREIATRLPALSRGWGVVVVGDLHDLRLASLRSLSPLRAFGARLTKPDGPLPEGPLDLLVIDFAGDLPAQKRASAPRLLRVMNFPERAPVPSGNNVGWVCPASHAALTALRYAALRANRKAISLADPGEP
jgi:phosphohistidine swiveling domain-containing protein